MYLYIFQEKYGRKKRNNNGCIIPTSNVKLPRKGIKKKKKALRDVPIVFIAPRR